MLGVAAAFLGAVAETFPQVEVLFGFLFFIAFLGAIWICVATSVRRCHDAGMSGWWIVVFIIPILGTLLALFVLGFLGGTPGSNRYGQNPRNTLDTDL